MRVCGECYKEQQSFSQLSRLLSLSLKKKNSSKSCYYHNFYSQPYRYVYEIQVKYLLKRISVVYVPHQTVRATFAVCVLMHFNIRQQKVKRLNFFS